MIDLFFKPTCDKCDNMRDSPYCMNQRELGESCCPSWHAKLTQDCIKLGCPIPQSNGFVDEYYPEKCKGVCIFTKIQFRREKVIF